MSKHLVIYAEAAHPRRNPKMRQQLRELWDEGKMVAFCYYRLPIVGLPG